MEAQHKKALKVNNITKTTSIIKQEIPYEFQKSFMRGESFTDPKTQATIGISEIKSNYTASGTLFLPNNKKNIVFKDIKPGHVWEFKKDKIEYKLTLTKISWISNSLEASVQEIKNK